MLGDYENELYTELLSKEPLGWHVCRVNFGIKDVFWATDCLTKNAPQISPKKLSHYSWVQKLPQNSPKKVLQNFPAKNLKVYWRAFAGAQGEGTLFRKLRLKNVIQYNLHGTIYEVFACQSVCLWQLQLPFQDVSHKNNTVRTDRATDRTFIISAMNQVMNFRQRASLELF